MNFIGIRLLKLTIEEVDFIIFSQDEKNLRYDFALNLKDSITSLDTCIDKLIIINESKLQTCRVNFYHNRLPSSYTRLAGIKPEAVNHFTFGQA